MIDPTKTRARHLLVAVPISVFVYVLVAEALWNFPHYSWGRLMYSLELGFVVCLPFALAAAFPAYFLFLKIKLLGYWPRAIFGTVVGMMLGASTGLYGILACAVTFFVTASVDYLVLSWLSQREPVIR